MRPGSSSQSGAHLATWVRAAVARRVIVAGEGAAPAGGGHERRRGVVHGGAAACRAWPWGLGAWESTR
jgi:hypothetical protein